MAAIHLPMIDRLIREFARELQRTVDRATAEMAAERKRLEEIARLES